MHPATAAIMRFFAWDHLQGAPREISRRYAEFAHEMVQQMPGRDPEVTVALRKLLESKDAAVRASLRLPMPS